LQPAPGGGDFDAFVTKINAAGSALIYSTYLGGSDTEFGNGIAVDAAGNACVTGSTGSANFPTKNPLQAALSGAPDAFVAKLNAAGNALVYSTYLGGSGNDSGSGIAVDPAGNAYVTGGTSSTDFPTQNPFQPVFSGGGPFGGDAFVTKLNAAGSALVYSTYLGGSDTNFGDSGRSIAVDASGNAYVTGVTGSTDFPAQNPFQPVFGGSAADAFVAKLNAAGTGLLYSTYLGGSANDSGSGIGVDSAGNAYVTGFTVSTNFPTKNPFQPALNGNSCPESPCPDAFVTKLNPAGSALVYSTYLGGQGSESVAGIAVDSAGNAYVTGETEGDFPIKNPLPLPSGSSPDAFVAKFNASGDDLVFSTLLGGSGVDRAFSIAVDASGSVYVTGRTETTDFPTQNPFQSANGGGDCGGSVCTDAFVTKITTSPLALRVAIDIKPGSSPNSINPRSNGNIPVAVVTTDSFDASSVDPSTIRFGRKGKEAAPLRSILEDVDGDGDLDLVLHFATQQTGLLCGDSSARLTGQTFDGQELEGSDSVRTVGCH
jgi:hypothetical protein